MQLRSFIKLMSVGALAAALSVTSVSASAAPKTIKLGYVEWDSCVAATNITKAVLEKAGYKVQTMAVSAALMFEGLANDDLDAIMCAWLPTTHADYYAKTKDRVVNLGSNMARADLGLAVPDYVNFKTIPDLAKASVSKEIGGRIIGIDPGAGLMRLTEKVIEHYKLPEKLVDGTDATMTAVLADAIRQHKPVVVTSWQPHWMWSTWKLRYLQDPDDVYGKPDHIDTLVRKGLKAADPKATAILGAIQIDGADRGAVMAADRKEGANPSKDAAQWVAEHPKRVAKWLAAPAG
jgi:glycine betaine/proline transport system substrate-binding protein